MPNLPRRSLFLLVFLIVSSRACGADGLSLETFRATLFGMVAAVPMPKNAGGERPLPAPVASVLTVGRSLVREGGLDAAAARRAAGVAPLGVIRRDDTILAAYDKLLREEAGSATGALGLLRVAPVALAYAGTPVEAIRAAGFAAAMERPDDTTLRACGRAYASVLLACLRGEENRRTILKDAEEACGSERVARAIMLARTHQPVSAASLDVADTLTLVLRAWYNATSYNDALHRLGPYAGTVRRGLAGVLAGARWGLGPVLRHHRPSANAARDVEWVSTRLHRLASDGLLLPVPTEDFGVRGAGVDASLRADVARVDSSADEHQVEEGAPGFLERRVVARAQVLPPREEDASPTHVDALVIEPIRAIAPIQPIGGIPPVGAGQERAVEVSADTSDARTHARRIVTPLRPQGPTATWAVFSE